MTSKNVRVFELKLGKRALILFIVGMSCLLFVVFLFGVTVGKNIDTYPEKFSHGFRGMMMEKLGLSSNRAETAVSVGETATETAKAGGEEIVPEEKKAPVAAAAASDEKQPSVPAATQTEIKPPAEQEKYQIQVGSFKEKEKADQLCKKLTRLGFSPRVAEMQVPKKGKWMRITLEGFESREDAQKAADRVARKIKGLNCVVLRMGAKNN
ncbi:MAG: SPOR domain-containing protein [Syntrophales bacterium]|jgi:cell division septation protein DedD